VQRACVRQDNAMLWIGSGYPRGNVEVPRDYARGNEGLDRRTKVPQRHKRRRSKHPQLSYLFYSGQLPFATAMANRAGGIVNTVGVEGAVTVKRHRAYWVERGAPQGDAMLNVEAFRWCEREQLD
jgi:hypothetical protein